MINYVCDHCKQPVVYPVYEIRTKYGNNGGDAIRHFHYGCIVAWVTEE